MDLLSVSSEVAPFSKTGGLGDVCQALPRALSQMGYRVATVSPCYQGAAHRDWVWESEGSFWYWLFGQNHEVRYVVARESDTLTHVLLYNPCFDREGIYGDHGGTYGDNQLRFALLARAALDVPRQVALWDEDPPGVVDVFHAHDWQASLVPVYLRALYKPVGLYPGARSLLTIHNAAHQGIFSPASLGGLDLSTRHWPLVEFHGELNSLKAGICAADHVNAVSPSFSRELQTVEGGFGLHEVMQRLAAEGRLSGILNGIDDVYWDPASDAGLDENFSVGDMGGKARCKEEFQRRLELPVRSDVPMIGMVARLDRQKGVNLVLDAAADILSRDVQLVLLGTGDPVLEEGLRALQAAYPDKCRALILFNGGFAHRVFGASDFFLVPSIFEPCGLTQMYAMRYGAVPIVRSTGGLKDSVEGWDPASETGTGWLFKEASGAALAEVVGWAVHTWEAYPEAYRKLQYKCMTQNWSWSEAAKNYAQIYESLVQG